MAVALTGGSGAPNGSDTLTTPGSTGDMILGFPMGYGLCTYTPSADWTNLAGAGSSPIVVDSTQTSAWALSQVRGAGTDSSYNMAPSGGYDYELKMIASFSGVDHIGDVQTAKLATGTLSQTIPAFTVVTDGSLAVAFCSGWDTDPGYPGSPSIPAGWTGRPECDTSDLFRMFTKPVNAGSYSATDLGTDDSSSWVSGVIVLEAAPTGPAAPTQVGTTQVSSGGMTPPVNKPTGVAVGDYLIAKFSLYAQGSPVAITMAGFTPLVNGGTGGARSSILYRIADGSEGSTFTYSAPGPPDGYCQLTAWRGVLGISAGAYGAVDAAIPGVTTPAANCMVLAMADDDSSGTTQPSGWSTVLNNHDGNFSIYSKVFPTAGATGTVNAGSNVQAGVLVSLSPVAPSAVTITDDFNRANGSMGSAWGNDWVVDGNQAHKGTGGDWARHLTHIGSPDHYVEVDIVNHDGWMVVNGRGSGSSTPYNCYQVIISPDRDIYLGKDIVGGGGSTISSSVNLGAGPLIGRVRLEVQGNAIRGYWKGVLKVSATDTTHTTGDYVGLNGNSASGVYDNFRAGPLPYVPVVYSDDFNRADGALTAPWVHYEGVHSIAGNKVGPGTLVPTTSYYNAPISNSQWSECDVTGMALGGSYMVAVCRINTNGNLYYFWMDVAASIQIVKRVGGSYYTLWTGSAKVPTGTFKCRLETEGTTIRAYINNALVAECGDSDIAGGKPGFLSTSGTGVSLDNFRAGDLPYVPAAGVTAPAQVTGLGATAVSGTQINLAWTAPSDGGSAITDYLIETSPNGSTGWTVITHAAITTPTTYSHTGLTAGVAYYYRVSAINSVGTGTASANANATTFSAPGAPTGLTAVSTARPRQAVLNWTAPASNGGSAITGYRIETSPNGTTGWTLVTNTGTTAVTYTHTGLTAGQAYFYRVSATNVVGTGTASGNANTTPTGHPSIRSTWTPGTAGTYTNLSTAANFTLPTGAGVGDLVLYFISSDNPAAVVITASTGWTEVVTSTITSNVHHAKVFARVLDGTTGNNILNPAGATTAYTAIGVCIYAGEHPFTTSTDLTTALFDVGAFNATASAPDPPNSNPATSADYLWLTYATIDKSVGTQTISTVPTNFTSEAFHDSSNSTMSSYARVGSRKFTGSSLDPGTFTASTNRPWIAFTLAVSPAVPKVGSAVATWTETQVATGKRTPKGSITAAHSWVTTAVGAVPSGFRYGWNGATPTYQAGSNSTQYALGTRFAVRQPVRALGVRVYMGSAAANMSDRIVKLWKHDGTLLASKNIDEDPAVWGTGSWREFLFDTPVELARGDTDVDTSGWYMVSHTVTGYYYVPGGSAFSAQSPETTDKMVRLLNDDYIGSDNPGNGVYNTNPALMPNTTNGLGVFYGVDVIYEPVVDPATYDTWKSLTDSPPLTTSDSAISIGTRFGVATDVLLYGVRYWRGSHNYGGTSPVGFHCVNGAGTATTIQAGNNSTFIASAPGWEDIIFDAPIPLAAATAHKVWVTLPTSGYGASNGALGSAVPSRGGLFTIQSNGGVYEQPPQFGGANEPTSSFSNSYYWVEPLVMLAPPTSFNDNFNRANGALGAPWVALPNIAGGDYAMPVIASNAASSAGASVEQAARLSGTFGPIQLIAATGSLGADYSEVGVMGHAANGNSSLFGVYATDGIPEEFAGIGDIDGPSYQLYYADGTNYHLISNVAAPNATATRRILLAVLASNQLEVWADGIRVLTGTDGGVVPRTGPPGFTQFGLTTTPTADNFHAEWYASMQAAPTITSFAPGTINPGTTVTVTGTGLVTDATMVTINGVNVAVTVTSPTSGTFAAPSTATGTYTATLRTPFGTTTASFTLSAPGPVFGSVVEITESAGGSTSLTFNAPPGVTGAANEETFVFIFGGYLDSADRTPSIPGFQLVGSVQYSAALSGFGLWSALAWFRANTNLTGVSTYTVNWTGGSVYLMRGVTGRVSNTSGFGATAVGVPLNFPAAIPQVAANTGDLSFTLAMMDGGGTLSTPSPWAVPTIAGTDLISHTEGFLIATSTGLTPAGNFGRTGADNAGIVASATFAAVSAVVPSTGSATASWTATAAAVGKRVPKSGITASHTWVLTAAGKKVPKGSTTASHSWTLAAVGKKVQNSAATVSHAWTVTAAGKKVPKATSAASWTVTLTAAGKKVQKGTSTASHDWTITGAGKRVPKGAPSAFAHTWTIAAQGVAPLPGVKQGTATANHGWTITGVGKKTPKGSAPASHTWTITASGTKPLRGSAAASHTWTLLAAGKKTPKGAVAATHSWAQTAAGQKPSGTTVVVTHLWTQTAVGRKTPRGLVTATHLWSVTDAGKRVSKGSATANYHFTQLAYGLSGITGRVDGLWNGDEVVEMMYGDKAVISWLLVPS